MNPVDNDAPVANPTTLIVREDTPATGALNAYDPDGGPLTYALTTPPANGTVTLNPDGTYTYTPNSNFFGADSFAITITDSSGATLVMPISFTVSPMNDSPVANPPPLTVTEDTPATGSLGASDPDGDLLGYVLAGPPANGTVVLNGDGTYTYTPNPNFFGADSFSVTISDSTGASITVSVAVTVNPVADDAPIANPTTLVVSEDTPATGALNAYDPDGGPLTYALTTPSANGTVTLNPDGTYTYTPNANFFGSDSFAITITDSSGTTLVVPISFTVAPVDDAPVGSDLSITPPEDGGFVGTLPAASDPEGQPVTFALGRPPSSGTATVNPDGTFSYVPAANFFGTDSFTYVISDGTSISVHTVTIEVTAVNDAPVAGGDVVQVPQDTSTIVPVLLNDGDVDGDPLIIIDAKPGIGTVSINPDGTLTYTPPSGFVGVTTIGYTISDGKGGRATGEVLVSVLPVSATLPSEGPRPPASAPRVQTPFQP